MASEKYRLTISDLLAGLQRRGLLITVSFGLVFALALGAAFVMPPVFQSKATILVESQQIPRDLLPSTITTFADDRIQVIRQRIMTRENQMQIIKKHHLFSDRSATMTTSDMLATMQQSTGVTPIHAGGGRRGAAAIAFEISFEHRSPETAQAVANELVTLFLKENARTRTERASETTDFLRREAKKLESELSRLEGQLASYKQKYSGALPEHLEMRMGMLGRAESELNNVVRETKSTLEEIRFLDVELAAANSGLYAGNTGEAGDINTLSGLTQEHERLKQHYTDRHPDVVLIKRRIEALKQAGDAQAGGKPGDDAAGMTEGRLRVAKVQARLDAAGNRLKSLYDNETSLKTQVARLEEQILETPQVQRALTNIMRDYSNAQAKFQEVRAKQIDAQIMESLERDEKAERFSLLEPPLLPTDPVKPNRNKIMLLGFFLAIGSSGGLALMAESLNRRIRGSGALTHLLGRSPIVVIPYIRTSAEIRRRRMFRQLTLFIFVGSVFAAGALLHFTYMPLDQLFMKIVARLG
ncbi:GumC family protein [Marinobacter salicampi]|uniref:GumC family protein n=1 Tax=Marinobacter salicampi TaxID=435907 RepID=UPI00140E7002|nr:Wzz/FepE/Etk N-terminal domain-containing protein [Marinobacter salicampi]